MNHNSCIKVNSGKGDCLLYKGNETVISLKKQRNSGSCLNKSSVKVTYVPSVVVKVLELVLTNDKGFLRSLN
jgi:hypothetical protein